MNTNEFTAKNPPSNLFNLPVVAVFKVKDFHISVGIDKKTITLFPIDERSNEAPLFGFLHYVPNFLVDVELTMDYIKRMGFLPSPQQLTNSQIHTGYLGSQIIAKHQFTPKSWSTDISKDGRLRKAPLFDFVMEPLLVLECSCETYVLFAMSLTKIFRELRDLYE